MLMEQDTRCRVLREPFFWLTIAACLAGRFALHSSHSFPFVIPSRFWQLLDAEWLRQDPLQSIYLMHMQPPLLNVLYALSLAMPGDLGPIFLQALFLASSVTMVTIVYFFLRRFGYGAAIAAAATLLFGMMPQVLVYENLFFYSHLEATLVLCAMFFASRYLTHRYIASFIGFAACLVTLAFLRSLFHIGWVAFVLLTIWGVASYRHGRQARVLVVVVVSTAAVATIYVKNFREFGIFSASSWQGVLLAHMLMPALPGDTAKFPEVVEDLQARAARGEFSKAMPRAAMMGTDLISGWVASAQGCDGAEKRPILCAVRQSHGGINYNHVAMVEYSAELGRDAPQLLRLYPGLYAHHVASSVITFLGIPAWDYLLLQPLPKAYMNVWNGLLLYDPGRVHVRNSSDSVVWASMRSRLAAVSLPLIALVLGGLAIALWRAGADFVGYGRAQQGSGDWMFPALVLVLFVLLPNLVNGIEAQRIRYSIEPILFLALARGAAMAFRAIAGGLGISARGR